MMCKKLFYLISVLVLSFACTGYADVVIGDWESDSYDGWIDWVTGQAIEAPKYTFSETGATLGSSALKMSPGGGWQQNLSVKLADIGMLDAFKAGTAFAIDVTYNSADWDPNTTYAGTYTLSLNAEGYGWNDVGGAKSPTGENGVVFTDTLNPDSPGNLPLIDPGTPGTTMTGTWTWDYSGVLDAIPDAPTYVEFIIATNSDAPGAYYFDNARIIGAEPPEPGPKIIYVTSVKDNDLDGVQDDLSWVDWLESEGYEVDARPGNWIDPLDANDIAELEAADLIIASRGMATGEYDGDETAKWNAVSTPIICTNAWMIRSSRWVWMNSGSANKDAGSPFLLALDPAHPIFAGVALDSDGLAEILDPTVASGHTSFLNDILDVGNGTLIAQSLGVYNTAWIVEWQAGVEYYEGAGQIAGGPRMLFMAGTQDDPYLAPDGVNTAPVGVLNLNDAGKQLFLNAIEYLLPAKLTHSYTFEDGTAADSVGGADGVLMGDAAVVDGSLVVDGDGDWAEMPGDVVAINTYSAMTLELWSTQSVDNPFSMTASMGGTWDNGFGKDYIFIATGRGDQMNRGAIANTPDSDSPWADEVGVSSPELNDGIEHHYVLTITAAELAYYVDGILIGVVPMGATTISGVSNDFIYLGKGTYSVDGTMNCSINEFNIYNKALSDAQIAANYDAGPAAAAPVLIAVENASFELPGTTKMNNWDGGTNAKGTFEDVPGWSSDTMAADSGVETGWVATDGIWSGFLKGADDSIWQLTSHVIGADDVIELKVDAADNWAATAIQLSLYYDEAGTRVTIASGDGVLSGDIQEFTLMINAADVPDAVGKQLGIELNNSSAEGESWAGIDNVRLSLL